MQLVENRPLSVPKWCPYHLEYQGGYDTHTAPTIQATSMDEGVAPGQQWKTISGNYIEIAVLGQLIQKVETHTGLTYS